LSESQRKSDTRLSDFRNFLYLAWETLGLPEPTDTQYDVAYQMQHGPNRLVLECWRGFGKSWIAAAFGVWSVREDLDTKVLPLSGAKKRADDQAQFMFQMISSMDETKHMIPTRAQRSSAIEFDVRGCRPAAAPSVRSLGILSSILQGSRANIIIPDDIETKKNSQTPLMRERVFEATKELGGAILVPGPFERVIYLGTPQIEESLYHRLPDRGYTIMIYPARYPLPEEIENYEGRLAPFITNKLKANPSLAGSPVDPARFGEDVLRRREIEYGKLGFELQFMLRQKLTQLEQFPIRLSDLITMELDHDNGPERLIWDDSSETQIDKNKLPMVGFSYDCYREPAAILGDMVPYQQAVMGVDPSGRGRDELAYSIVKFLNGQAFLLDVGGYLGGYTPQTMQRLANAAKKWNVQTVVVEDNFGDGMFTTLFGQHLRAAYPGCGLVDVHNSGVKDYRLVDGLEPVISAHRLVVSKEVIRKDYNTAQERAGDGSTNFQLFYQLTRLRKEAKSLPHYDRIESLHIALRHFEGLLGKDPSHEMEKRKTRDFDDELRDFRNNVFGRSCTLTGGAKPRRSASWFN